MTDSLSPSPEAARLDAIPCPVLRALVQEGKLTPDARGRVDLAQVDAALAGIGVGTTTRKILVAAAKEQGVEQNVRQPDGPDATPSNSQFNILQLRGGTLDHAGDTRVLRHGFDAARLDWLMGFSADGQRLTLTDIAKAQLAARNEEPTGLRGTVLGMVELTALVQLFGTRDANGEQAITLEALRSLYEHARLPASTKMTTPQFLAAVAKVALVQARTVVRRVLGR